MMPEAEDARKGAELPIKNETGVAHEILTTSDHPIAPDQFDPKWETSKWEIYFYYAFYVGNCGLGNFNFGPSAAQNLLYQAAGDSGFIYFLGSVRTINSVILLANGISFAIQAVLLLGIGAYAGAAVENRDSASYLMLEKR